MCTYRQDRTCVYSYAAKSSVYFLLKLKEARQMLLGILINVCMSALKCASWKEEILEEEEEEEDVQQQLKR